MTHGAICTRVWVTRLWNVHTTQQINSDRDSKKSNFSRGLLEVNRCHFGRHHNSLTIFDFMVRDRADRSSCSNHQFCWSDTVRKKIFGTFWHYRCPLGEFFLDRWIDRWPLMIFIKVFCVAICNASQWKWPLNLWVINHELKKPKKTQKNLWWTFFSKKCQQEKVLRICSSICVQSFIQF